MKSRGTTIGRLVKWSKRRGWEIGSPPILYRLGGLYEFKRHQFAGAGAWYNRPRKRKAT